MLLRLPRGPRAHCAAYLSPTTWKMDPQTGFPLPGPGYGKKLVGGNHSRIKGLYILYSPRTVYYFFLGLSRLNARGGTTSGYVSPGWGSLPASGFTRCFSTHRIGS